MIAANSFRTTLPKVNPWISVGVGTAASITLAVTGRAGDVMGVFTIMAHRSVHLRRDGCRLPAGRTQVVRATHGFNPAGWISWAVGFVVGGAGLVPALNGVVPPIPCPPVAAFLVGFILYAVLTKARCPDADPEDAAAG